MIRIFYLIYDFYKSRELLVRWFRDCTIMLTWFFKIQIKLIEDKADKKNAEF